MKNLIKASLYSAAGIYFGTLATANAAIDEGQGRVQGGLKGSENSADVAIQNIIQNLLIFLAILAVIYALWGGFNILTAGGDEEKVKKGKTIIIHAVIGLVVIFLANSIVEFTFNFLETF